MNKPCIAILACAFASVAMPARGDDGDTPPSSKAPAQQAPEATRPGNTSAGQETPKDKAKRSAVEAATRGDSLAPKASGGEPLGRRGPPGPGKNWDAMTPEEKDASRKRWLLNSGDFGPPGRPPRATPKSLPMTKERQTAVEAAEKAGAPKTNVPAR